RGVIDPEEQALALARRREGLAAELAPPPLARSRRARAAPALGDERDRDLWVPIGPTVVLAGQASGRPRVAGRVTDVRVSNDGRRIYAATANGGVWYSSDAGETWSPLGGWAVSATPPDVTVPSNVLACGCIHVRFDPGG